jgi:hypothetical protein
VVQDEDRHRDLLGRIAATLRDTLDRTDSLDALPRSGSVAGAPPEALLMAMRALVRKERAGARKLRQLALLTNGLYGGLPKLLLETMALDSDKQERTLRFILRRLERSERTAGRGGWADGEDTGGAA